MVAPHENLTFKELAKMSPQKTQREQSVKEEQNREHNKQNQFEDMLQIEECSQKSIECWRKVKLVDAAPEF